MSEISFAPYAKPRILLQLEQLEASGRLNFEALPFLLEFPKKYWPCTPVDAVVFANTGGDGCHFAFLTDFGRHQDLETAPIVFVSPTDFGEEVTLVANNLPDLLALLCCAKYSEVFRTCRPGGFEETAAEMQKKLLEGSKHYFFDQLHALLGVPYWTPAEAESYLFKVQAERMQLARISTLDKLGIVGEPDKDFKVFDGQVVDEAAVRAFLESTSRLERLKFYRDLKFPFESKPESVIELACAFLQKDGLEREAKVFRVSVWR